MSRPQARVFVGIGAFSALAVAGLIWLLYGAIPAHPMPPWVHALPAFNASFNGLSALAALVGWWAVRRSLLKLHRACMLSALGFSTAFLLSYVLYHHYHGDTRFPGVGWSAGLYYFILISHVLLSVLVLPLLLSVLWLALSGQFEWHRRLARWILPIWMYVSVTGVIVYLYLRPYY